MNIKKALKIIGNIITIAVVYFIIKRLLNYDVDWSKLIIKRNFIIMCTLVIAYALNVIFICIPWKNILEIITSKKIKFKDIALVSCKANTMKYIPGNIFQYVGRNEIAFKAEISHLDVGISTVLDILTNVLSIFITSILLYYPGIKIWIDTFGLSSFKLIRIIIIITIILSLIIFIKFKDKILNYISKFEIFFCKKNFKIIVTNVLYYSIQGIFTSILFLVLLTEIIGVNVVINEINVVLGAFLLSWILGFIMIGAPAGIGIREATMTLLVGNIIQPESVLLSMVIYRIVTTIGDIVALIFAKLINMKK